MTRSVTDAAIVLNTIAGVDKNDNATSTQPHHVPDYTRALRKNALKGKRIGVPRKVFLDDLVSENDPSVNVIFEEALEVIRNLGATVVDPADLPTAEQILAIANQNETFVLEVDFKVSY
jgi:amidase